MAGYAQRGTGWQVAAIWFCDAPPVQDNRTAPIDLILSKGEFREPLLVDLRTGLVYHIPPTQVSRTAAGTGFRAIPMYDSSLLIAEKALLPVSPIIPVGSDAKP